MAAGNRRRTTPPFVGYFWYLAFFWMLSVVASFEKKIVNATFKDSPHILFISMGLRGHAMPLIRAAEALKALHPKYRVSFASHENARGWIPQHRNISFWSAGSLPYVTEDMHSMVEELATDQSSFRALLMWFQHVYVPSALPLHRNLEPLVKSDKPDLVVLDIATIGGLYLVEKLDLLHVLNSPSLVFDMDGTPSPGILPSWGTGFGKDMPLWTRCMNLLFPRLLAVALTPSYIEINRHRWQLDLPPYRSMHEVFRKSRILVNTAIGLDYPQRISPLLDLVGPIMPLNHTNGDLPKLISRWLNLESNVVLISFGTIPRVDEALATALIEALTPVPGEDDSFRVLWMLSKDQRGLLPNVLPPNFRIKTLGRIPHLQILAHPSVRIAISHCGMGVAQEALYYAKPLLCIPFAGDQVDVAARVIDSGAGLSVSRSEITPEEIREKLWEVATDSTYRDRASGVSQFLSAAGGAAKVVQIIDSTLLVGYDYLRPADATFPWHKSVMLDVIAVYTALFCLGTAFLQFLYLCMRIIVTRVAGKSESNTPKFGS